MWPKEDLIYAIGIIALDIVPRPEIIPSLYRPLTILDFVVPKIWIKMVGFALKLIIYYYKVLEFNLFISGLFPLKKVKLSIKLLGMAKVKIVQDSENLRMRALILFW